MNRERISWVAAALLLLLTLFLFRELSQKDEQMQELQNEYAVLEERSGFLSELCILAENESLGYGAENFRADKSTIALRCGETKELWLTAYWEGSGSVSLDCRGDSAELAFTEESWEKSTAMSIKGIHPGLTVARFSSDAAEDTFYVWILVEE